MSIFNKIKKYLSGENITKVSEHKISENWICDVLYFNKNDDRFLVAKRNPKLGCTFKFAHPITFIVLILILFIVRSQTLY